MTEASTIFIRCPGCKFTVRALDDTACPECGRCAFCGRKLESDAAHCGCQRAQDYEAMPWLMRDDAIPADQVATEVRRMEIRKQLELKETIVNALLGGVMLVAVGIGYPDIVHENWLVIFGVSVLWVMIQRVLVGSFVNWIFSMVADRRLRLEYDVSTGFPFQSQN